MQWLDEPAQALSIAMIPLRHESLAGAFGLLVLASPDPTRYTADMGTDFLARIGEVASAALTRLLPRDVSDVAAPSADARPPRARDADIARHLEHLAVERRLAARTLSLYGEAFDRLQRFAARARRCRCAQAEMHHIRRWAAQLHGAGLAPRSIALDALGLARPLPLARPRRPGRRQPGRRRARAARRPAAAQGAFGRRRGGAGRRIATSAATPLLAARDACIAELLYGCGLRVGELVGLDVVASAAAAGWIDAADASAHVLGKGSKRRSVPVGRAGAAGARARGWRSAASVRAPASRPSSSAAAARG